MNHLNSIYQFILLRSQLLKQYVYKKKGKTQSKHPFLNQLFTGYVIP